MKVIERRDELMSKLGTIPDNALAKEFHITRERVRQLRKEKGIPVFRLSRPRQGPRTAIKSGRRKKTEYAETYKEELSSLKKFELPHKE